MTSKRNHAHGRAVAGADVLADLSQWLAPDEYVSELPKFATRGAILRDIHNRKHNGLEKAGIIRKVGKRFLIHKTKYTAYRLGELRG